MSFLSQVSSPFPGYPLRHLRVVNFGWLWSAPTLGHLLGDLGVEVIKVESRRRIDLTRMSGVWLNGHQAESLYSHSNFRSQLGLLLEMEDPKAVDAAKALVAQSDAVVENYRPGVMARYGLDYERLRKVKPDLVMLSMSAAGQTGPLNWISGYGASLDALMGTDGMQGYGPDHPLPLGAALPDPFNGVVGCYGLLAALMHRARTGQGQYIDMAQWEAIGSIYGPPFLDFVMNGRIAGPVGNRDVMMAPHNSYRCKGDPSTSSGQADAWVTIAVKTEDEWRRFRKALGGPAWAAEERFADAYQRKRHEAELDQRIEAWTQERNDFEVTDLLQSAGVAAFPSLSQRELFTDAHFRERQTWAEVEHPLGRETIYGVHWKFSDTPGWVRGPCPMLGQHNNYVLRELLGLEPGPSPS